MAGYRVKPKKNEQATAKEAVDKVLNHLGFDPNKFAVFEIWDKEVKSLMKGCEAVALHGQRLCVRTPSAAHRQELMYAKERLINKINQAMGKKTITDIRFELSAGEPHIKTQNNGGTLSGEHSTSRWNRRFGKKHG